MSWMRSHPAQRIVVDQLGELFNTAYMKAATTESAVNGFCCTGIVPFNRSILPDSDFFNDLREAVSTSSSTDHAPATDHAQALTDPAPA